MPPPNLSEAPDDHELAKEKQALETLLTKQIQRLQRKELNLSKALEQCAQWPHIQHEGELIKANFTSIKKGLTSLSVWDWLTHQPYQLTLDSRKTPQEQMATRFRRAKKLQAGLAPLTQQLKQTQTALETIKQQQQNLHLLTTRDELEAFKSEIKQQSSPPLKPNQVGIPSTSPIYREYQSAKGLKIWVGKHAKANDKLTFQLAHGHDWWLHVKGYSGSHVIIRLDKDQQPDHETLKDAMQLALYYSKAKTQGEAEVCLTQRKYVSRLRKGQAGQVQISKHQIVWVRLDPKRVQQMINPRL